MKICGLRIYTPRQYEKHHEETLRLGEAVGRLSVKLDGGADPLPPTPPERPRRHLHAVEDEAA